jgi:hypothetical protein
MPKLAVRVCPAGSVACTVRAQIGRAVEQLCPLTGSLAIASSGRVREHGARTRGGPTRSVFWIERARPGTITRARRAARRGQVGRARRMGQAGINEFATSYRAGLIARHASPGASDIAAHAVGTVPGDTVVVVRAQKAVQFLSATLGKTGLSSGTLLVRYTGIRAFVGGWIATVREARGRRALRTSTLSVTRQGSSNRVHIAGSCLALGSDDVFATAALAVAGAVLPAGRGRGGTARMGVARFHTRRDERAVTKRRRQIACLARFGAGRSATDAVDAEAGTALAVARAGFRLSLGSRARLGETRGGSIRRGCGRQAIGAVCIAPRIATAYRARIDEVGVCFGIVPSG